MRPQIARPQRRSLQPSGGDRASTPTLPVSNPPLSAPSALTDRSNSVISLKPRICVYVIDCSSGPSAYVIHVIRRRSPVNSPHGVELRSHLSSSCAEPRMHVCPKRRNDAIRWPHACPAAPYGSYCYFGVGHYRVHALPPLQPCLPVRPQI